MHDVIIFGPRRNEPLVGASLYWKKDMTTHDKHAPDPSCYKVMPGISWKPLMLRVSMSSSSKKTDCHSPAAERDVHRAPKVIEFSLPSGMLCAISLACSERQQNQIIHCCCHEEHSTNYKIILPSKCASYSPHRPFGEGDLQRHS